MKYGIVIILFIISLCACSIEEQPINYNEDQCFACKMMISDQKFGAELVTTKGKVFKYDAIECMVRDVIKNSTTDYALLLVTDFHHPGQLINAENATFIISKERPSPMGAFLSAYETETQIENEIKTPPAVIYSWIDLLNYFATSH